MESHEPASGASPSTSGRDRLQQMQAEQARKARQNKLLGLVAALVTVVLVAIAGMWLVSHNSDKSANATALTQAHDDSFIPSVTSIPASTFDAVGAGSTQSGAFQALPGGQPLTENGKPRILYIGAEFCPWCAMERWGLVAALSRFGSFQGLKGELSSSTEAVELRNVQTMTFRNAKYTSPYVALTTYEVEDRTGNPLQQPSAADQALWQHYVPKQTFPWIDWGGQVAGTINYDAQSLLVGKTNKQIAAALKDPHSAIAQGVLGSANVNSAQICKLTKNQPANVCNSAGVKAAAKNLG